MYVGKPKIEVGFIKSDDVKSLECITGDFSVINSDGVIGKMVSYNAIFVKCTDQFG